MTKPKQFARTAGIVYLLMAILGGYAQLGVRASIHVPGDAATSVQNLTADPTPFRLALVADIAMATAFVVVGVLLFLLLRHVDRHAAGVPSSTARASVLQEQGAARWSHEPAG